MKPLLIFLTFALLGAVAYVVLDPCARFSLRCAYAAGDGNARIVCFAAELASLGGPPSPAQCRVFLDEMGSK